MVYFYSISLCFELLFSSIGLANPAVVLSRKKKARLAEFKAFDIYVTEPEQDYDSVRFRSPKSLGITAPPLSIGDLS